jgi:hypothetical protein
VACTPQPALPLAKALQSNPVGVLLEKKYRVSDNSDNNMGS